jgi:phenylalanyl-tRNA synthetase beta chain
MIVSWNWLCELVPLKVTPAELVERLMMAGLNHEGTEALGNDLAIDLEITSNRPDCLGHIGVAREAAVLFDLPLRYSAADLSAFRPAQPRGERVADDIRHYTSVEVACPELCPRYVARLIRGVRVGPSPAWMAVRLATVGQPVINNVVDATNYVLMECGQPLHAFDFQKLRGRRIVVRRARPGETFTAINHQTYTLDGEMCVIADAERPVAIGGVMGGEETEITPQTSDVLIEAAQFAPLSIRGTARKLKLHSPSSYRFERGTDPEMVDWASRRACELILKHAGGELVEGVIDVGPPRPRRPAITLRLSQIPRVLGIEVPMEKVRKLLVALGCREESAGPSEIVTIPPSWRRDLEREIDLVEEVARLHGYDQIPEDAVVPLAASHRPHAERVRNEVRRVLTAAGCHEAMTASVVPARSSELFSPWTDAPPLATLTPMLEGADRLRRSLVPSLLEARRLNESLSNPSCDLFEMAMIYVPTWPADGRSASPTVCEQWTLSVASGGGFYHLKGVVEALLEVLHIGTPLRVADWAHPLLAAGTACALHLGEQRLGFLGEVAPAALKELGLARPAAVLELALPVLVAAAPAVTRYAPRSPYPPIDRELNLIVAESVRWADLAETVQQACGPLLERLEYLDTYRDPAKDGPQTKRLHFAFHLRAADRTLTGQEADAIRDAVVAACRERHAARLLG